MQSYRERIESDQRRRLRAAAANPAVGGMFGTRPLGPAPRPPGRLQRIGLAAAYFPLGALLAVLAQSHLDQGGALDAWGLVLAGLHGVALIAGLAAAVAGRRRPDLPVIALDLAAGYALITALALVVLP